MALSCGRTYKYIISNYIVEVVLCCVCVGGGVISRSTIAIIRAVRCHSLTPNQIWEYKLSREEALQIRNPLKYTEGELFKQDQRVSSVQSGCSTFQNISKLVFHQLAAGLRVKTLNLRPAFSHSYFPRKDKMKNKCGAHL